MGGNVYGSTNCHTDMDAHQTWFPRQQLTSHVYTFGLGLKYTIDMVSRFVIKDGPRLLAMQSCCNHIWHQKWSPSLSIRIYEMLLMLTKHLSRVDEFYCLFPLVSVWSSFPLPPHLISSISRSFPCLVSVPMQIVTRYVAQLSDTFLDHQHTSKITF